jgi:N-acetylneuraminate synthase/sialic acid synthase
VAYILGARVIEKHFTLNRAMKGTDHAFSLEPQGMQKLVRDIDRAKLALGDGIKGTYPSEVAPLKKMGKSIFYRKNLAAGEVLKAEHVDFRSPGDGTSPYRVSEFIGMVLRKNVVIESKLDPEDF